MYGEDTFKPPVLPYCFDTKVKQEDSVRQRLQKAATELWEDLTTDIVFTLEELYSTASSCTGHALRLHVGHNTGVSVAIQSEGLSSDTYLQVQSKVPETRESMMASEVRTMLFKGTIDIGPGDKGFITYPFLIPKKKGESHFIMNLKLLK